MVAAQNTQVSLYRSTVINAFGDVQQVRGSPLYAGLPACLVERTGQVLDPATQTPMTVRGSVLYLDPWVEPQVADQIVDSATGDLYAVEEVIRPPTIIGVASDVRCSLRRVTGQGT
jgi:hypothetical protein